MTEVIFTYRPFELRKKISWINLITRQISKRGRDLVYAPDHVAIKHKGYVYESSAGVGVHRIQYSEWVKGREGTTLQVYEVPHYYIDLDMFELVKGRPYDYRSALFHFFGYEKGMKRRAFKAFTCSEFVGLMIGHKEWYKALPIDIKEELEAAKFELEEIVLNG